MAALDNSKFLQIGANIRKWRDIKGMKQEALAEELDISPVAMSKIETGKTNIPLKRLFAIAAVLQIDVQLLFVDPETILQTISKVDVVTKFLG